MLIQKKKKMLPVFALLNVTRQPTHIRARFLEIFNHPSWDSQCKDKETLLSSTRSQELKSSNSDIKRNKLDIVLNIILGIAIADIEQLSSHLFQEQVHKPNNIDMREFRFSFFFFWLFSFFFFRFFIFFILFFFFYPFSLYEYTFIKKTRFCVPYLRSK